MNSNEMYNWIPVSLSADVPSETVIPVWTPAGEIALWRSRKGYLAASADRCPHRGMRLSHGFVRGERLSCIYHGWGFDQDGHCQRIPAHPGLEPPGSINTQNQIAEECGGVIWVAAERPDMPPPLFKGSVPLRSMTVDAPAGAFERAGCAKPAGDGLLRIMVGGIEVGFLVVPQGDRQTLIHLFLDEKAGSPERIAASRAAETLRRVAEDLARKEVAK